MRICTFASGSKGNCSLVSASGFNFLIDAGISMKRICANLALCSLKPCDINGILVTHQHSDHISGLAMLTKHHRVPIYAPVSVARYLRVCLGCGDDLIRVLPVGESLRFGNELVVKSFPTSHDTEESVGYRFEADRVFAYATDTGCVTDAVFAGLVGADAVVIESNHDLDMLRYGSYPYQLKQRIMSPRGHLSNDDCAQLARLLASRGTRYFILGHLSRENNTPARALSTVSDALEGCGVQVYVAPEAERLSLEIGGGRI